MEWQYTPRDSEPYQNQSVFWRVIDEVIQGIRTRKYRPGSRLPTEKEFMDQLQISRGSVREAIKILSALGIVVIRRGEGTFVASADDAVIVDSVVYTMLMENTPPEETLEFRNQIDDMVLRLAAKKVTEEDIRELEDRIAEMRRAYQEGQLELVRKLDVQFHLRIVDFTRNSYIRKMMKGVYEFVAPEFVIKNPSREKYFDLAERSHEDIVRFLRTKDYDELEKSGYYQRSEVWYDYDHLQSEKTPQNSADRMP